MVTTQQPSTKQDILQHLMKQGGATAHELATELNISPQAIRRHLKDLETEELISYQAVQLGMGRDSHGQFAVSLLDTLAQTVGHDQMSSILRKQWELKALEYRKSVGNGCLQERVANLVELRKAEGFMAEWYRVDGDSDMASCDRFILIEHNCAISNVAASFPVVCGHELEMFAAVLPDCKVERTHWQINGEHRCGYLVQARIES